MCCKRFSPPILLKKLRSGNRLYREKLTREKNGHEISYSIHVTRCVFNGNSSSGIFLGQMEKGKELGKKPKCKPSHGNQSRLQKVETSERKYFSWTRRQN